MEKKKGPPESSLFILERIFNCIGKDIKFCQSTVETSHSFKGFDGNVLAEDELRSA